MGPDGLQEPIVQLGMVFGAITAIVVGWKKWLGPAVLEIRDVVRKAGRVFDMLLSEHTLPMTDGTVKKFDLPSAFAHLAEGQNDILAWQREHDSRWPPNAEK